MCDSGVACVDVENDSRARFDTTGGWHSEFSCALELVRGQKSHVKYVIFVFSKSGGKNANFVFRLVTKVPTLLLEDRAKNSRTATPVPGVCDAPSLPRWQNHAHSLSCCDTAHPTVFVFSPHY